MHRGMEGLVENSPPGTGCFPEWGLKLARCRTPKRLGAWARNRVFPRVGIETDSPAWHRPPRVLPEQGVSPSGD